MNNAIQGGKYCQMCDFGLKMVIFCPFQSLVNMADLAIMYEVIFKSKSVVERAWETDATPSQTFGDFFELIAMCRGCQAAGRKYVTKLPMKRKAQAL